MTRISRNASRNPQTNQPSRYIYSEAKLGKARLRPYLRNDSLPKTRECVESNCSARRTKETIDTRHAHRWPPSAEFPRGLLALLVFHPARLILTSLGRHLKAKVHRRIVDPTKSPIRGRSPVFALLAHQFVSHARKLLGKRVEVEIELSEKYCEAPPWHMAKLSPDPLSGTKHSSARGLIYLAKDFTLQGHHREHHQWLHHARRH